MKCKKTADVHMNDRRLLPFLFVRSTVITLVEYLLKRFKALLFPQVAQSVLDYFGQVVIGASAGDYIIVIA